MKNRCIIIGACKTAAIRSLVDITSDDYIICADGGYILAEGEKIVPDILIGDFDSMPPGKDLPCKTIKLPKEKDDTDTLMCLKYGIEQGFDDFVIVGGTGGRLDHTLANIQTLAFACKHGKTACMLDENSFITVIENRSLTFKKNGYDYISLFSYSPQCTGVHIRRVKYILDDAVLTNVFPLGVSNEFLAEAAEISVREGMLLVLAVKA